MGVGGPRYRATCGPGGFSGLQRAYTRVFSRLGGSGRGRERSGALSGWHATIQGAEQDAEVSNGVEDDPGEDAGGRGSDELLNDARGDEGKEGPMTRG